MIVAARVLITRKDGTTEERWFAGPELRRSTPHAHLARFFPTEAAAEAAVMAARMELVALVTLEAASAATRSA